MTALLPFTTWISRFTDAEYALFRHRMRAVQFIGGNITRRWDQATALNTIDLDDPIMPMFKDALVREGILQPARADMVFSSDGTSSVPPVEGEGSQGPPGPVGPPGPSAVSANAGNVAKLGTDNLIFVSVPTSVKGVTDGSDAAAGNVGEVISASVSTGVGLTTNVVANLAALNLTPGDWNVGGVVIFTPAGTGPNSVIAALSQTAATLPTDNDVATGKAIMQQIWASSMPSNKTQTTPTSLIRVNTSTPKSVFLVALATFGGGSVNATGYVSARRVR